VVVIANGKSDLTPGNCREKLTHHKIFYIPLLDVKHYTPERFMKMILEMFPKLKTIVVGYDFCFGKGRSACGADIQKWFLGSVKIVEEVKLGDISIHSRIVRGYLRVGDIKKVNELLGRNYQVIGDVIKGQGLGMRKLFPTLNLNIKEHLIPAEGVYATKSTIEGHSYDSVSFIGHRVSTDGRFAVETHILNEDIDEANRVSIDFIAKIRDNRMFPNIDELKKAIKQDIHESRKILKGQNV
jgi:riboflavin kinase / FMN adenylyltransferase